MTLIATLALARELLEALVTDTRAMSKCVAMLEHVEGVDGERTERLIAECHATVAELVTRYRTGRSILTVPAAAVDRDRQRVERADHERRILHTMIHVARRTPSRLRKRSRRK